MNKSAILENGLNVIKKSREIDNNPYFPQYYRDYDSTYNNKFTGNRNWNHEPTPGLLIPGNNSFYVRK